MSAEHWLLFHEGELELLAMIKFSFNTLLHYFSKASLQRCVSDFTADLFLSEKELFSRTYVLIKAPQRPK